MKRNLMVVLFSAAAVILPCTQLSAHHSFAATYLEDQTVVIEGDIAAFQFRNPHSFVHVNVKEKDGTVIRYGIEWGGTAQLGGSGVTRETLKVGDHVIISGSPGRNPKDHRVRMVTLHRTRDNFGWGKRPGEVVD